MADTKERVDTKEVLSMLAALSKWASDRDEQLGVADGHTLALISPVLNTLIRINMERNMAKEKKGGMA